MSTWKNWRLFDTRKLKQISATETSRQPNIDRECPVTNRTANIVALPASLEVMNTSAAL